MAADGVNFAPFFAICLIYGMESKSENSVSIEERCIFVKVFNSSRSHVRTNPPSLPRSLHLLPSTGCTQNLYLQHRSNCETDILLYSSAPIIDTALKNHIHKILPTFFLVWQKYMTLIFHVEKSFTIRGTCTYLPCGIYVHKYK